MHSNRNIDQDRIAAPVWPASPRRTLACPVRARQPWGRLLKAMLELAGDQAELVRHVERDWASATFSGSRHAISLGFFGPQAAEAGEAFIIALPDHAFVIPRYLVADAQIIAVDDNQLPERRMIVEAQLLLLEPA